MQQLSVVSLMAVSVIGMVAASRRMLGQVLSYLVPK